MAVPAGRLAFQSWSYPLVMRPSPSRTSARRLKLRCWLDLAEGRDINAERDAADQTLLHVLSVLGCVDEIKELLAAGAPRDSRRSYSLCASVGDLPPALQSVAVARGRWERVVAAFHASGSAT
jgi:hypothetical protein